MKKIQILIIIAFLFSFKLSAKDIEKMSYLTINGVIELRDKIGAGEEFIKEGA